MVTSGLNPETIDKFRQVSIIVIHWQSDCQCHKQRFSVWPIGCRLVYKKQLFCYTLGNHDYFLRNTSLCRKTLLPFFLCGPGVIFSTKCTNT